MILPGIIAANALRRGGGVVGMFRVYQSTAAGFNAHAWRDLHFDTVVEDADAGWDATGQILFTVPTSWSGKYGEFFLGIEGNNIALTRLDIVKVTSGSTVEPYGQTFEDRGPFTVSTGPLLMASGDQWKGQAWGTNSAVGWGSVDQTSFFAAFLYQ